jgi:hypothetical protein
MRAASGQGGGMGRKAPQPRTLKEPAMIRLFVAVALFNAVVLAAALAGAQIAAAQGFEGPRPAFDLTGAEVDSVARACFGPTGRPFPCRRTPPLR